MACATVTPLFLPPMIRRRRMYLWLNGVKGELAPIGLTLYLLYQLADESYDIALVSLLIAVTVVPGSMPRIPTLTGMHHATYRTLAAPAAVGVALKGAIVPAEMCRPRFFIHLFRAKFSGRGQSYVDTKPYGRKKRLVYMTMTAPAIRAAIYA